MSRSWCGRWSWGWSWSWAWCWCVSGQSFRDGTAQSKLAIAASVIEIVSADIPNHGSAQTTGQGVFTLDDGCFDVIVTDPQAAGEGVRTAFLLGISDHLVGAAFDGFADFVVSQESGLFGDESSSAGSGSGSRRTGLARRKSPRSSVKRDAQDDFRSRCTLADVVVDDVVDVVVASLPRSLEQGSVMVGLSFPRAVHVVRHDVDEIHVVAHYFDIITGINNMASSRDSHAEDVTFGSEGFTQRFQKIGEAVSIGGFGILPIDIQTVEVVFVEESHDRGDEVVDFGRTGHQLGILRSMRIVGSSDGDQSLQFGVLLLHVVELSVGALIEVQPRIESFDGERGAIETGERVDVMGAQERVQIGNGELALAGTIIGPIGEITKEAGGHSGADNTAQKSQSDQFHFFSSI